MGGVTRKCLCFLEPDAEDFLCGWFLFVARPLLFIGRLLLFIARLLLFIGRPSGSASCPTRRTRRCAAARVPYLSTPMSVPVGTPVGTPMSTPAEYPCRVPLSSTP